MGDGSSRRSLSSSDQNPHRNTDDLQYSDDIQSDSGVHWSPGDGICPSTAQFNHCYQTKLEEWKKSISNISIEGHDVLTYSTRAFLGILENVPPFFHHPPERVNIAGRPRSFLILRSSICIKTTEDADCKKPQKTIGYIQCIGSPKPATYKTTSETQSHATFPGSVFRNILYPRYFTSIVLAWSYIISCRWVEILQQAGEKSQVFHDRDTQTEDSFWDIVTQGCWVAHVKKQKAIFYSPWMLRRDSTTKKKWDNLKPVESNSSLAFERLLSFCKSEGLQAELLTGFASILLLTSRNVPPPTLAPPIIIPATTTTVGTPSAQSMILHELFQSIDKCMFLSATQDALDSLLCSAFFDPCIPCNLIGAASLGVSDALSAADTMDNQRLLRAITQKKPHLAILWTAAACNGQATSLLNMALYNLPPICLVTALLTNTTQSFLQIQYHPDDPETSMISRAIEFQVSFFSRPDTSVPWSPAPPFGATPVENLSLEVRAHLAHQHRPIEWAIYWILDSGERIPASKTHQSGNFQARRIYEFDSYPVDQSDDLPPGERNIADEQSAMATSRLFNWHRSYDDGIWLDDGKGDVERTRQLMKHPWIIDQFDSLENEPLADQKHRELCIEGILRWRGEVEAFQLAGW